MFFLVERYWNLIKQESLGHKTGAFFAVPMPSFGHPEAENLEIGAAALTEKQSSPAVKSAKLIGTLVVLPSGKLTQLMTIYSEFSR